MIREVLLIIDIIGLGMLLGGGVYESIVMNPNYRSSIPQAIVSLRQFMKVTTPANFFRIVSPITMLSLLATVLILWNSTNGKWWFITAFVMLLIADSITYAFHYPRNKVLFINPLSSDNDLLSRLAREWQIGNLVRIVLLTIATISILCGIL